VALGDKYTLRFKGLSVGTHHFEYTVDDAFLAAFETSEIHRGDVRVDLTADRQPSMLTLDFRMAGDVEVACDRCLGEFRMPVAYAGRLLVKFAETPPEESDGEVMWLHPTETEADLAQYIYESIVLSLPYQRVHPLDAAGNPTCDPEMLARFRIVSGEQFDEMFPEQSVDGETQSAWESQLAELKARMEEDNDKK